MTAWPPIIKGAFAAERSKERKRPGRMHRTVQVNFIKVLHYLAAMNVSLTASALLSVFLARSSSTVNRDSGTVRENRVRATRSGVFAAHRTPASQRRGGD